MVRRTYAESGRRNVAVVLCCSVVWLLGTWAHAAQRTDKAENIALGKPYTLSPPPNYQHCTDPGDGTQLTDGKTTKEYFWTQRGTVGWQHARYATITVDLGRVEPIGGVALTTAAGVAGVTWPLAVHVLVSDDGRSFRDAGDLVALDLEEHGPWPDGYAIRRLVTHRLATRGRYVQLVLIPPAGGPYLFTDEVEVFRGPPDLASRLPSGPVTTAEQVYRRGRLARAVQYRFRQDVEAFRAALSAAQLPRSAAAELTERLERIARRLRSERVDGRAEFRAVLPLSATHAELFSLQARLWRALGRPPLGAHVPPRWDPLDPFALPPAEPGGTIQLHTILGEYRASAVNLYNASPQPMDVKIRFSGLPGSPRPEYVTVHEVAWTDTSQGIPVAAALPLARPAAEAWVVRVLPGLVRQVWFTFHVQRLEPGEYRGSVEIQGEGGVRQDVAVRLKVWPFRLPEQTSLYLGGWSYTNGSGGYGVTAANRDAFVSHLREHFVNAPWATSSVLRSFRLEPGNPPRVHLDTREWDDWVRQWPGAKRYMVFLAVAHYGGTIRSSLGDAEIGSPQFNRYVGAWISAWVGHLRDQGIAPNQLGLLIHDEPHEGSDITALLAWAKAIQAAEPEVLIWLDPTYRNPAAAPRELFELCDVLCPNRPMWLQRRQSFEAFYGQQRRQGRQLQFYSCSGPAKLLDPYSYYRLQAWHGWHVGGDGSFFWAFGDNGGSSSWNEYLAKAGPYTPLFLDDRSVTAGKQMEAIRESVEDYEYLVMLRRVVDEAERAGRDDRAVARAQKLLRTAAQRVLEAAGADSLRWHEPKDRTVADRVRVEILEALAALR